MKRLVVMCSMLFAACSSTNGPASDSLASQAGAAIHQMEQQDGDAVNGCHEAVAGCDDTTADAAPAEICARLSSHCEGLDGDLGRVRGPAVGCWQDVEACAQNNGADCADQAATCDEYDNDLEKNRGPILECSDIAEQCYADAAAAGTAVDTCDEIVAACDHVGDLAADAEDARAHHDENADDMCQEAHNAVPGRGDRGGETSDSDEAIHERDTEDGDHPDFEVDSDMGDHPDFEADSDMGDHPDFEVDSDMGDRPDFEADSDMGDRPDFEADSDMGDRPDFEADSDGDTEWGNDGETYDSDKAIEGDDAPHGRPDDTEASWREEG